MPHLHNWTVTKCSSNPYKAPELWSWKLTGIVTGSDKHTDGTEIITSKVIKLDTTGRKATTKSGTEYALGEPSVSWLAWLKENNFELSDFDRK